MTPSPAPLGSPTKSFQKRKKPIKIAKKKINPRKSKKTEAGASADGTGADAAPGQHSRWEMPTPVARRERLEPSRSRSGPAARRWNGSLGSSRDGKRGTASWRRCWNQQNVPAGRCWNSPGSSGMSRDLPDPFPPPLPPTSLEKEESFIPLIFLMKEKQKRNQMHFRQPSVGLPGGGVLRPPLCFLPSLPRPSAAGGCRRQGSDPWILPLAPDDARREELLVPLLLSSPSSRFLQMEFYKSIFKELYVCNK